MAAKAMSSAINLIARQWAGCTGAISPPGGRPFGEMIDWLAFYNHWRPHCMLDYLSARQ
jgi:hypothetical protein